MLPKINEDSFPVVAVLYGLIVEVQSLGNISSNPYFSFLYTFQSTVSSAGTVVCVVDGVVGITFVWTGGTIGGWMTDGCSFVFELKK